ncbi:dual oxidase maturation factor 1 [Lingula anatina]|uniref:Dual oxidase maturation factor 1 n=1 Tax=Lingula anatina TaxID=7574 RepID=A0A1S3J0U9_LINAN|nr:dual oxidase maturation factor 1 [Lingula anatina]|eukprot:XP_013403434.2 dual oxidase maturation factor 1 [Lingula anatina]
MGIIESKEPVISRAWTPGLFDTFRNKSGPTLYGPLKTPVTADVLEAGFIYAIAILAFSLLIILPGVRHKERIFYFVRVVVSLWIGSIIILANFGQEWELSEVHTKTQYRAGINHEINASIKVAIGLRSVNITLKGTPENQVSETINYNERFHWDEEPGWQQGRFGFGPYSGLVQREFRRGQYRGLPYPILWVAEYFTLDGEGIRWGRHYRQAGFYSHIMLWLAFPLWIICNILFFMVIRYGSYFLFFTGSCMVLANILYASIRNPTELVIPWEEAVMEFHYGWCFWLCLITGVLSIVFSMIILFMDLRFPSEISTFFGVDVLQDWEEYYADPDQDDVNRKALRISNKGLRQKENGESKEELTTSYLPMSSGSPNGTNEDDASDDNVYENPVSAPVPKFRKRAATNTQRFQKSRRKPRPTPRESPAGQDRSPREDDHHTTFLSIPDSAAIEESEEPDDEYENVVHARYQPAGTEDVSISIEKVPPRPPKRTS